MLDMVTNVAMLLYLGVVNVFIPPCPDRTALIYWCALYVGAFVSGLSFMRVNPHIAKRIARRVGGMTPGWALLALLILGVEFHITTELTAYLKNAVSEEDVRVCYACYVLTGGGHFFFYGMASYYWFEYRKS